MVPTRTFVQTGILFDIAGVVAADVAAFDLFSTRAHSGLFPLRPSLPCSAKGAETERQQEEPQQSGKNTRKIFNESQSGMQSAGNLKTQEIPIDGRTYQSDSAAG